MKKNEIDFCNALLVGEGRQHEWEVKWAEAMGHQVGLEKGREEGRREGLEQGRRAGIRQLAKRLIAEGVSKEVIALSAGCKVDTVEMLLAETHREDEGGSD